MRNRIISIQDNLNQSYWFIPLVMVMTGIILSFVAIELDEHVGVQFAQNLGVYINTPEGARAVLSTIAGSTITVVSLVFSLMMVVLSLAAAQYGPLILGNFMSDRSNQLVLGMFTTSFIYCLLVLRTIRDSESMLFIPHIATLVGVTMAVLDVGILIYFIHHVSDSIKPSSITHRITETLIASIEDLFPEQIGLSVNNGEASQPADFQANAHPIRASKSGYLQMIDDNALMNIAVENGVLIKLHVTPGDFIVKDSILGETYPKESAALTGAINDTFIIGRNRTVTQDVRFLFEQLVEIAVRGLSPALNDPFTASMCIDRLSEGLCSFARRSVPSNYRYDDNQQLRVIAKSPSFEEMIDLSFDQIRHYGGGDVRIVMRMMSSLQTIAECTNEPHQRETLRRYLNMLWQESRQRLTAEWDRQEAEVCYQRSIDSF